MDLDWPPWQLPRASGMVPVTRWSDGIHIALPQENSRLPGSRDRAGGDVSAAVTGLLSRCREPELHHPFNLPSTPLNREESCSWDTLRTAAMTAV